MTKRELRQELKEVAEAENLTIEAMERYVTKGEYREVPWDILGFLGLGLLFFAHESDLRKQLKELEGAM